MTISANRWREGVVLRCAFLSEFTEGSDGEVSGEPFFLDRLFTAACFTARLWIAECYGKKCCFYRVVSAGRIMNVFPGYTMLSY